MPKMKTHSSAKKRFKVTGSGKIKYRHANTSHLLRNRTKKRKRHLAQDAFVSEGDMKRVKALLNL
ncbi:MAG TPA: 50S ribosomal protein L35 [Saprospiraceae bacterium]|nr:50S ribosomal protein L35 [Saprospiraceae bacterium]HMP26170.1 50S ribosomal protein L35 [Saprospiraceae bacterium]